MNIDILWMLTSTHVSYKKAPKQKTHPSSHMYFFMFQMDFGKGQKNPIFCVNIQEVQMFDLCVKCTY